ncbi:MAG: MoxR family ATPase [Bdellovibrionales bacterium]|nr:MoxR family ATPase [Bdellovibrionales bacterium]
MNLSSTPHSTDSENCLQASLTAQKLRAALSSVIRGRQDTIDLVLTALFADGHVLLEDYPGSGKTLLTKTLGRLIADHTQEANHHILPFRRIQFTPDMLPGDILGVNIFDAKSGTFRFIHGPVFAHVVLADELNRTGPKVQAAFLECMAEKQVTIDNVTYPLDDLFFVVGTQNPLDLAGTYPLPLVQLDRFLLRIPMSYVDADTENEILLEHTAIMKNAATLEPVVSRHEVLDAQRESNSIHISDAIRETIVAIVQSTRNSSIFQFGLSTRAALMFQRALRSWAVVQGRTFVDEDDLKTIAPHVLIHRMRFQGGVRDTRGVFDEFLAPHIDTLVQRKA